MTFGLPEVTVREVVRASEQWLELLDSEQRLWPYNSRNWHVYQCQLQLRVRLLREYLALMTHIKQLTASEFA